MKKAFHLWWGLLLNVAAHSQSVTIQPRSSLVIKGAAFLVVNNAAVINNGQLIDSMGTVKFSGEKDSTYCYFSGSKVTSLYNIEVDKSAHGAALKSPVAVRNKVGVYNGILYADSNLILHSDENLTARVDVIPAGADIKGKAIVERFYPNRRAWRLVTAPLSATPSIFDTWQNKGVYEAGINTLVSGPNPGGAAGNGLDPSPQNNSSLKIWNVNTQSLESVLNTKVPLSPGNTGTADNRGYFLFVRGDRDVNNFIIPNSNNTTLKSSGNLQTGLQAFTAAATAGGYTLIGNPYASPVDFNSITLNNLVKRFYVWDPSLNVVGGYVMLDDLDGDGVFTKSVGSSVPNNHIQSSQAFFVQTLNNGPAAVVFAESDKSSGNNNALFRPVGNNSIQRMRIQLVKVQDTAALLTDEVLLECSEDFSDTVDADDALKFTNINECISLVRNNIPLTAERRPSLTTADTLFIKLSRTVPAHYRFEIHTEHVNNMLLQGWLEDSYLQTATPVDLHQTTVLDFIIDNNSASAATNRFRIVFKQLVVLPVSFISVKAFGNNQQITVNWTVANEVNTSRYEIERSGNGRDFAIIGQTPSTGNSAYYFTDKNPLTGRNYYRIKSLSKDGSILYSQIVSVMEETSSAVSIYPNPVINNTIHIYFDENNSADYHFRLFNTQGQLVHETDTKPVTHTVTITPKIKLPAGNYQLEITTGGKKIIKQIIIAH